MPISSPRALIFAKPLWQLGPPLLTQMCIFASFSFCSWFVIGQQSINSTMSKLIYHEKSFMMIYVLTFSFRARIMPLNVAATSVKLAIPPPITRARFRPSGFEVAHCKEISIERNNHYIMLISHILTHSKQGMDGIN